MAASQTDEHAIVQVEAMHSGRVFPRLPVSIAMIGLIAALVMVAAALIALQTRGSAGIGWVWAGWALACAFVVGQVSNMMAERGVAAWRRRGDG